ncbi:hypothetical protein Dimus_016651 [Dionaea muscipula]
MARPRRWSRATRATRRVRTSKTATFGVRGDGFCARTWGSEHAGPGTPGGGFEGERTVSRLPQLRFDGYKTPSTHEEVRAVSDSTISSTVDFIFDNGATAISCMIIVRLHRANQFNAVTAQGRLGKSEPTAIVIQSANRAGACARPTKPQGYEPWGGTMHTDTAFYGEYANRGPGAKTNLRVKWKNVKVLSTAEAEEYTAEVFLKGMLPALKASWCTT